MAFDLASLKRGKSADPPRVVIYGEHGIGKSTFAASAPRPVFIVTEDGLGNIDTTSFPIARSYQDIVDALATLYNEAHEFETVCLDSLDWLETLVLKHVESKYSDKERAYGKEAVYVADLFRELLAGFNALRLERGMAVILTAHCQVRRFDDPTSDPYDRYSLKLSKHAGAVVQEWADVVGFASDQVAIRKADVGFNKETRRAVAKGERKLFVSRTPAYDAKNRYGMPDSIPLSWADFVAAINPNE